MRKRLISIAVVMVMLLSFVPVIASSYTGTKYGDYLYYEETGGAITITDCDELAKSVVIPETINGLPVNRIGDRAFFECHDLTDAVIPFSVVSIGEDAFNLSGIKKIVIPDTVTEILQRAFYHCKSLESVSLSRNVQVIDDRVFAFCSNLKTIEIPDGVKELKFGAFYGCTSLSKAIIPASVSKFGGNVFFQCSSLNDLSVNSENLHFCSINNVVYRRDMTALMVYPGGISASSFSIPQGVKDVHKGAFCSNTHIREIEIPDTLLTVAEYAFDGCININDIYYYGSEEQWNTIEIKNNNSGLKSPIHYNSLMDLTYGDYRYSLNYERTDARITRYFGTESRLVIPDNFGGIPVTSIAEEVFYKHDNLVSVEIPDSITEISQRAFYNCKSLESVSLSRNLQVIDDRVFAFCSNLKTIEIPDGVKEIKFGAFYSCTSLSRASIPASVSRIGGSVFFGCSSLVDLIADNTGNYRSFNGVVYSRDMKTLVIYPGGFVAASFSIPQGVKDIYKGAFCANNNLKSITIPGSVENIGYSAFDKCDMLFDVYYGGSEVNWAKITIDSYNESLFKADIHFNGSSVSPSTNGFMPADINNVTINHRGTAYGWFEVKKTDGSAAAYKKVSYTVDGGKSRTTTTDEYGYACVEVNNITQSRDYTIAITGNGVQNTSGTLSVTVEPLHFKSSYEATLTKGADVGLSFGVGGSIGNLGAEAEAASIGVSGSNKKGLSVSQEYKDKKNKLSITAKSSTDAAVKAKAGLWAGAKWDKVAGLEASAGDIHGDASCGNTASIGFEDDDFNIHDMGDVKPLGLFMLSAMLSSVDSNVAVRYLIDKFQFGADTYEKGSTASLGAGASIGDLSVKKGDKKIASVTLGGIDGKSVWSQSTKTSKDGSVSRSSRIAAGAGVKIFDAKINAKADNVKFSGGTAVYSNNFINNDVGFAAADDKNGNLRSVSMTLTENKSNNILWKSFTGSNKRTVSYSGETAERVASKSKPLDDFVRGDKGFFGLSEVIDGKNAMLGSGERGTFIASTNEKKGLDISASASVELFVKIGGKVGISGVEGYEYDTENGIYDHDFAYIQAHNDIASDVADKYLGVEDMFAAAAGYMGEKIAECWDKISGFIDGVKDTVVDAGKATIKKGKEFVGGMYVSIIKAKESIGSLFVLAVEDEAALFDTSSLAVTVGDPYIISVEDEDGNDVDDFGDTPLMLTLEYTDEDLANAGVTDLSEMAIYRWDEDKCVYVRMGGELDEAAMNMSLEIYKPGQYILAVDNCPPAVTMFTATTGSEPEISAVVSDMSGIADLKMTIDGETVVDSYNADEYYNPVTAAFRYPASGLSDGTHTAVIYAEDTSGNYIDGGAVLEFNVNTSAPVIESVSDAPQTAEDAFTVEANVSGAAEDMVYLNVEEYTPSGAVISSSKAMTLADGVYTAEVNDVAENSTVYTWINAYNTEGNPSSSEKQVTCMTADKPALVFTGGTDSARTVQLVNAEEGGDLKIAEYDNTGRLLDLNTTVFNGEYEYEKNEPNVNVTIMLWEDEMKPRTNFLSW